MQWHGSAGLAVSAFSIPVTVVPVSSGLVWIVTGVLTLDTADPVLSHQSDTPLSGRESLIPYDHSITSRSHC